MLSEIRSRIITPHGAIMRRVYMPYPCFRQLCVLQQQGSYLPWQGHDEVLLAGLALPQEEEDWARHDGLTRNRFGSTGG